MMMFPDPSTRRSTSFSEPETAIEQFLHVSALAVSTGLGIVLLSSILVA
jgi:hypothetical protein